VAENRDLNETTPDELLVRCAWCERIKRGDRWVKPPEVEAMRLTPAAVVHRSHGICPDCFAKLTPPNRP
jgi:NMD protein affecting ribosome stability and mRNA decay